MTEMTDDEMLDAAESAAMEIEKSIDRHLPGTTRSEIGGHREYFPCGGCSAARAAMASGSQPLPRVVLALITYFVAVQDAVRVKLLVKRSERRRLRISKESYQAGSDPNPVLR